MKNPWNPSLGICSKKGREKMAAKKEADKAPVHEVLEEDDEFEVPPPPLSLAHLVHTFPSLWAGTLNRGAEESVARPPQPCRPTG